MRAHVPLPAPSGPIVHITPLCCIYLLELVLAWHSGRARLDLPSRALVIGQLLLTILSAFYLLVRHP